MNNDNNDWGDIMDGYFKPHKNVEQASAMDYDKIEKAYLESEEKQESEVDDMFGYEDYEEPEVEGTEIDELPEGYTGEQTTEGLLEEMEKARIKSSMEIASMIQKEAEQLVKEYQEKETDLTPEEIAEFARLNGIDVTKATLSEDGKTLEVEANVSANHPLAEHQVVIAEKPTETKVRSVKVNKPVEKPAKKEVKKATPVKKQTKVEKQEKPEKPAKPTKVKAPVKKVTAPKKTKN